MKPARTLRLLAAAVLVATTAAVSALALLAVAGGGAVKVGPISVMRVSDGYGRAAHRLMDRPDLTAADFDEAERLARENLALSPYDVSGWLRLALIDVRRDGRLDAAGSEALARSYELLPYDVALGVWRIGFALDHWQAIAPETRLAVREEALMLARIRTRRALLLARLESVGSSSGVLAAALIRSGIEREARQRRELR